MNNRLINIGMLAKVLVLCIGLSAGIGCSSVVNSHRQKEPLMQAYMKGNTGDVEEIISAKLANPDDISWYQWGRLSDNVVNTGDEIMWRLEAGSWYFYNGNYSESIAQFERAEALIAEYDQRAVISMRDVGSETAMLFTNLNALPYRGFCRDRIMIPVYKAMAYLAQGNEEAFNVELYRIRQNQDKVIKDYQSFFDNEQKVLDNAKKTNPEQAGFANKNINDLTTSSERRL